MTRTTRGSSASPAKGAAPAKARLVATPGATLPSPRKVGRPPKAESGAATGEDGSGKGAGGGEVVVGEVHGSEVVDCGAEEGVL